MRFVVVAVMLAFSTPASDARADDDPSELERKVVECAAQHREDFRTACAKEVRACDERNDLESKREKQLKKGMTYEEVLNAMVRQPDIVNTITYGNGTGATRYAWYSFKKKRIFFAHFIDGRLSWFGGSMGDDFQPGWFCG